MSNNIVDRATADALIKKCRDACEAIFKDAGFEMVKSGGSFGDRLDVRFSAIPSAKNELGLNPNRPEVVDFHRYHKLFEVHEKALGVSFTVGNASYKLIGIAPNRTKFPLVVENEAGEKKLLTTDPRVIAAINQAATALDGPVSPPPQTTPAPKKKPRASR